MEGDGKWRWVFGSEGCLVKVGLEQMKWGWKQGDVVLGVGGR